MELSNGAFVWQRLSLIAFHGVAGALQAASRGFINIARIKILDLLHVVLAQAFYGWAMRGLSPTHPVVPKIMLRQHQLAEKYHRMLA